MQIESLTRSIEHAKPKRPYPVLIGIEGFGGSGKTTLSKQLGEALGKAYIIHMDDFIVKAKLAEPSWDSGVYDHARLEEQVLRPATNGATIVYQKLLYDADSLSEPIEVPPVDYVIIEGLTCYIPRLAGYYDFKIWIDTPIQVARARGQARSGTHGSADDWAAWAKIDLAYQQKYHSELVADYIVTNG